MRYLTLLKTGTRIVLFFLLLLFGLSSIRQLWVGSQQIGDTGSERLDQWEADMQLVREALPIERGVVGYITEEDVEGAEYAYWDIETEFLLTQYALAPLIVQKGAVAEWNVAALTEDDLETWLQAHPGQYEVFKIKGKFNILHAVGNP